jgi:hypothetical protein
MKFNINKWIIGLAAVGAVAYASAVRAQTNTLPPYQNLLQSLTPSKSALFSETEVTIGAGYNRSMKDVIEDAGVFTKLADNLTAGVIAAHDAYGFRSCAATVNVTGTFHGIVLSAGGGSGYDFSARKVCGVIWTSAGYPVKIFGQNIIPTVAMENSSTRLGNEYFLNFTYKF